MKNLLRLAKVEILYNILVQMDYLTGLIVAYMLGSEQWTKFFVALGVSLILGIATVRTYIHMLRSVYREAIDD